MAVWLRPVQRAYQKATERDAAPGPLTRPQRSYDHLANWEIGLE